ncbi:30S ribosomal protein S10 [Candidatus Vidania fulgoroideorum]
MKKLNNCGFFIKIKSTNLKEIVALSNKILLFLKESKSLFKGPVNIPKKKTIFNILKSPHKDKDSRDQFGYCIYKKIFIIKKIYKCFFIKMLKTFSISSDIEIEITN